MTKANTMSLVWEMPERAWHTKRPDWVNDRQAKERARKKRKAARNEEGC